MKNYYEILKVSMDATEEEIKKAYRKLAKEYHPDNTDNALAAERFKEINEANSILSNKEKRKEYDEFLKSSKVTNDSEFKEEKEKFNKEREEYLIFLNEMEPKFNLYNWTLKNEIEQVKKMEWSRELKFDFWGLKFKVTDAYNKLVEDTKAYDDFLRFLDEMKEKFNKYGQSYKLKEIRESINGKRGEISSLELEKKKTEINYDLIELEKNVQAYDEFMHFLDEMKEKTKKYDIDIELEEIRESINGKRGEISSLELQEKKEQINAKFKELKKNVQAYDEFVHFLDIMEEKAKIYGLTLKGTRNNIIGKRGQITFSQLQKMRYLINVDFREIERNNQAYDDLIIFLDKNEKKAQKYNINFKKIRDDIKGKRGKISSLELQEKKDMINSNMIKREENAKAYNEFLNFCFDLKDELKKCDLQIEKKYTDPKNKFLFEPETYRKLKIEISRELPRLQRLRKTELQQLKIELTKRNFNYEEYLIKRNLNEEIISLSQIETFLNSIMLIDKLNKNLQLFGITLDDFIKAFYKSKTLIDLTYAELKVMDKIITNYLIKVHTKKQALNLETLKKLYFTEFKNSKPVKQSR